MARQDYVLDVSSSDIDCAPFEEEALLEFPEELDSPKSAHGRRATRKAIESYMERKLLRHQLTEFAN